MNDAAEARALLRRFLIEWDANRHKSEGERLNFWDAITEGRLEILNAPLELRRHIVREIPAALVWSDENVINNGVLQFLWKRELSKEAYVELPKLAATNQINFALIYALNFDYRGLPRRNHLERDERYELTYRFYRASPQVLAHLREQLPARLAALDPSDPANHIHTLDVEKHFLEVTAHLDVGTLPDNLDDAANVVFQAFNAYWEALDERERGFSGLLEESAVGQLILGQPPELREALRLNILNRLIEDPLNDGMHNESPLFLGWLYQQPPEPTLAEIGLIYTLTERYLELRGPLFGPVYRAAKRGVTPPVMVLAAFRRAFPEVKPEGGDAEDELVKVRELLALLPELNPGEAWADKALADLDTLPPETRSLWRKLLEHCAAAKASKPTQRWTKQAVVLLQKLDDKTPADWLPSWLGLVGKPRTFPLRAYDGQSFQTWERLSFFAYDGVSFDPYHEPIVRGLAWSLALLPPSRGSARALTHLAQTSLKKAPGVGPRSHKTATAALYALSQLGDAHALAGLAQLRSRVTFKPTLKEIDRALDAVAAKTGLSREDLEELSVPTFGLNEWGVRTETLGDATAELRVSGKNVVLTWRNAAGKALKSPPAAVKRDFTEELKELKAAQKDAAQALSTIAARLDNSFLAQKSWLLEVWRERYLEHPLIGTVARRLIWVIDGKSVGVTDIGFEDANGEVQTFADDAVVTLWHPLEHEPDVMAWRAWLAERHVTQPFKQAHREVYRLTGAEEQTRVYSNRFAAHILKQHQFNALCALRGWRNTLRLDVDHEAPPATLALPLWSLRAEFWVESVVSEHGSETTETGTFLYLSTDQVRFYPANAGENSAHMAGGPYHLHYHSDAPVEPVPLTELPPLVFSEVMRDVDLFVGVTGVANDPLWFDRADEHGDYWQTTSFGELSATAETRKALLAELLPRLSLRDSCRLEGRFLVVQGVLRTYRIHLGSTNILMEPGSQYLCIVPSRGFGWSGDGVFLPFEGDSALSIILSKAFMLADDTAITDPLIVSQIKR